MQPFTVDDLYLHKKVSELHCVATRDAVAAVLRSVDRENDGYTSSIWICPLAGDPPRQLTRGSALDSSPRWSPQGDRIAFVSTREGGSQQLYLIDPDGGEALSCGAPTSGVSAHRWLPDGKSLLLSLMLDVNPDDRGRRNETPKPRRAAQPEVAWRLPYKEDGSGYTLAREVHLFHFDPATGQRRQLTDGPFDVHGFDPSPDARHVAYVRHREGRFTHRTDLWMCDMDGSNHRQLTSDLATVMQPVWSPDGSRIAFSGSAAEGDSQTGLFIIDVASGDVRCLADDELEVAALTDAVCWTADGKRLLVARAHAGCHQLVSVDPASEALQTLVEGERQFGAFSGTPDHLVYSIESPVLPSDIHVCDAAGEGPERQLTQFNAWWNERTPLEATRRKFNVPDGEGGEETIEGWFIRAKSSPRPQPLLNDVHGGPAAYALLDFDTNVFWQVLCSRGWAVLALNPVGSASYGRRFCSRLAGRWGKLDLPQHLAAVEQLQAGGDADDRVAISGKSYGGFLSAWAVGHADTFRAAVVMAPVGNIETHYGTSDGGYYADPLYLNTAPHFDRELARALSPLQHIAKAATPTLFLQGKEDERCPKCQSEEMFVTLCRAGTTPTELVMYPGESHLFLGEGKPDCRADAADRIVDWLEGHIGNAAPAKHTQDTVKPSQAPAPAGPRVLEKQHEPAMAEAGAGNGSA
ncbi:MAG TPA: S9 family peptidase [Rubrivivax sp.]|nr:S9 family peptidase [Rubrivivax sp.]